MIPTTPHPRAPRKAGRLFLALALVCAAPGKTSLLKQLEYLTAGSAAGGTLGGTPARRTTDRGYFPLFWDFQGSDDPGELHLDFADALLDAEDRLEELGIELAAVEADDLFVSLGRLRRKLRSQGRKLLLLCDEVEELIELHKKSPALLRKLRRAMQSREDIRSVLASSIRLWDLAEERENTSPFLHGFTPSVRPPGEENPGWPSPGKPGTRE